MAATFDTAIPALIEVCEGSAIFASANSACVVRDLRGCVRLVVDAPGSPDLGVLKEDIQKRLGRWFKGPILNKQASAPPERRLASELLGRAGGWPSAWPRSRSDATGASIEIGSKWIGYQRVLSKQAWLEGGAVDGGVWPLEAGSPAIVAFYSFKGGVGRSTLLGVSAWQLAKAGKKVVCLDLDLEAPGLAGLFGVSADASVIDHLLCHAATGQLPDDDPVVYVTVHGVKIGVVPAGRIERGTIEKLARLDYLGAVTAQDSPVARALNVLLQRIKGKHKPNYILLDCRAGIHDLGGLSLTDVAHVDVLVGRDTPQGREGLALTLEVLNARRLPSSQRILVAQTMVPLPLNGEVAKGTRDRFRLAMHEACKHTLYKDLDDEPADDDKGVAHYPWAIGLYDEIAACEHLGEVSPSLLDNEVFGDLRRRLEALALPEEAQLPAEGAP